MKKQMKTKLLGCLAAACLGVSAFCNVGAYTQANFSVTYPSISGAKNVAYGTNNDGDGMFAVFIRSASNTNSKTRYWLYEQDTYKFLSGTLDVAYNQYAETYYSGYAGQKVYMKGSTIGTSGMSVSGYWRH